MSHTLGPWEIVCYSSHEELKEIGNVEIKNSEGEVIIDGCGCCDSPRMSSIEDLHLIAAAPELLEALNRILEWDFEKLRATPNHVDWREVFCDLDNASNAIAKARGRV